MTTDDSKPFRDRVASLSLGPAERRLAEQLFNIPAFELGTMTSSDLSERSGTSRSSIDRLSRRLGYPGLKEMRKALLLEASRDARPDSTGDGVQPASAAEIARRVMAGVATRVTAMAATLASGSDLDRLVDQVLAARQIQMFGAGESAAICSVLYMRLIRLGLPISFADEFHTQVTLASLMKPDDLAIAISFSGGTKSVLWAAKVAKNNGARIVAMTGVPGSALAKLGDLRLLLPTGSGLPGSAEVLDRVVAAAVAEVLFQCIGAKAPELLAHSMRIDDAFGEARG